MLRNYIKTAWKVLQRRPLYTIITLFGITFTLTILIVTTSLIDHLIGDHYPEVNRSKSLYIQHVKLLDSTGNSSVTNALSLAFIKQYIIPLSELATVSISSITEQSNAIIADKDIEVQTKYTDSNFWRITEFHFIDGGPFTDQQVENASQIVIITDDLAHQYFGDITAVNKKLIVNGQIRHVVGVVKTAPTTRPMSFADLYLPYTINSPQASQSSLTGKYEVTILASSSDDLGKIKNQFNEYVSKVELPQLSDGFKTYNIEVSANTFIETLVKNIPLVGNSSKSTLLLITVLVALAFMGLPAINLVNLNSSRIIERSSEIGVRKAFGAPISALVWQFIVESVFISCIGGFISILLSSIILFFLNSSNLIPKAQLIININVFLISLLASIVFGLLSGVLPAFRMARIPISEALHQ